VVAFRRGSMPEIVRDGETGFLCESVEEAVERLRAVAALDRRACRRWVEARFTADRMVDDYLAVYRRILEGRRP
jgi:glycosyltransferase involved in cell wall biosynthesis